jgi:hypothetical protein
MRVLCATHNGLAARQVFGEAWMNRFTSKAEQPGSARAPRGTGASLALFSEIGDEEAPAADPL